MKIENSEKNLKLMQFSIDRASVGVFWVDPDARFIYVNDAVCKSLGYSKEELLEMTVHDIDPKFPKKVWPKHWKDIKKRHSFSFESIHKRKDGSTFPVEISVNYFKHKTKEYNLAFAKEITGRKHAETDLKVSEEKYRVITENSPIGLYSNDLKGNFLYGNKAAEKIIGYTARELIGKNFLNLKLLNPQDLKKAAKFLALNVLGKGTGPDEFTLNRKDGTRAVVEIITRVINMG